MSIKDKLTKWMPWNWGKQPVPVHARRRDEPATGPATRYSDDAPMWPTPFDRLDEWMDRFWQEPMGLLDTPWPRVDVQEHDDAIHVTAELPGLSADDIDVSADEHTLTIRGERRQEHEDKSNGAYRRELYYGSFHRTIALPAEVDPEQVEATYRRGELVVKLPKRHPGAASRRRIEVKAA